MTNSFRVWAADLSLADAALAAALALLLVTALALRSRRGARWPELTCLGAFGGYLIVLAMVVLCPLPGMSSAGDPDSPRFIISTTLDLRGFLGPGLDNQNLQNLLLALPFGFGLPFVARRRGRWLVVACLVLPVVLEGSQLIASLIAGWAYRAVDVNDYLANSAGALLGLALFTWATWLLSLTRRPGEDLAPRRKAARTAAAAAAAVIAVAGGLWSLGPVETTDYATACQGAPPADAARPLPGWTAHLDAEQLCLTYPGGSTTAGAGSADIVLVPDEQGAVAVVGQAPAHSSRVVVTLPDGRSTEGRLHPLHGLAGRLVYAAMLDPVPAAAAGLDSATVTVEFFAADGSRLPH